MIADLTQSYHEAFRDGLRPFQGQLSELFGINEGNAMMVTPYSVVGNVSFHPDSFPTGSIHPTRGSRI